MNHVLVLLLILQQSKLPDGPGKTAVIRACGTCHTADVVLNNNNSKQGWTELVDEMISKGAMANSAERKQIIAYLSRHFPLRAN